MISTVVVTIGAVTLAILLLGASGAALLVYLRRELGSENSLGGLVEQYGIRISQLEVSVEGLPSLWEEERRRAKRDADSARKAREHAEAKLEEVQELIKENAGLPEPDGGDLELPEMRSRLGLPRQENHQDRVAAVAHLLR